MSLSISAPAPTQPAPTPPQPAKAPAQPASAQAQPAKAPAPAAVATKQPVQPQASGDTVILSLSAQAIQLNQQGQQPLQIAFDLGIPLSTVDSYLGIATSAGA